MRVYPGTWFAIAAAGAFGGVGVFAKLAFEQGWDLTSLLGFRFLIAALVLLPFALRTGGRWSGFHKAVILGMFGYVAMTMLYFSSFRELPAAAASFMLYLAPVFVAIYTRLFDGGFRIWWMGGLFSSTLGLAFMFGGAFTGLLSVTGLLLAGGSAVVYAGLFIVGKRILKTVSPARTVLGICIGACVGNLLIATMQGNLLSPRSPSAWGIVIGLGVVSTALALLFFYAALSRAPSTQVAIISTLEPVATLALAFVVIGEALPVMGLIGGLCILLGAALVAVEPPVALRQFRATPHKSSGRLQGVPERRKNVKNSAHSPFGEPPRRAPQCRGRMRVGSKARELSP